MVRAERVGHVDEHVHGGQDSYLFLAIPAALLLALGLFGLLACPDAVETLVDRLGSIALLSTTDPAARPPLWCSPRSSKTWGTAAAVVVTLVWLWLSGLALLIGAEVNAAAERSRELRRVELAESELEGSLSKNPTTPGGGA